MYTSLRWLLNLKASKITRKRYNADDFGTVSNQSLYSERRMKKVVKIGTRGSLLALAQAKLVQEKLSTLGVDSDLVVIKTSGDRIQDKSLADIGGKALFTKEIERALLKEQIDVAVHSMKDVETRRPPGLTIGAVLERDDPRDAFLSNLDFSMDSLVPGVRVGTCSPRRAAQVLAKQPKANIILFRGNIHTRLEKLKRQEVDVTFLALAGLKRANLEGYVTEIVDPDVMVPAAGQGVIGIECLDSKTEILSFLKSMTHHKTARCLALERCYLSFLEGNCHTPVGALALEEEPGHYFMRTFVATVDGVRSMKKTLRGSFDKVMIEAESLGREAKEWLTPYQGACKNAFF